MRPTIPGGLRLRVPEFWEGLMRAFNVQGSLPDALGTTLEPGVQVADLERMEHRWLKRWRTYETGNLVNAVAAQRAGLSLSLTSLTPNVLVVVEKLWVLCAAQQNFAVRITTTAGFSGTARVSVADGRVETTPAPLLLLNVGTSAAAFPPVPLGPLHTVGAGTYVEIPGPWVLVSTAGAVQTLQIEGDVVNSTVSLGARWFERSLAPSEL